MNGSGLFLTVLLILIGIICGISWIILWIKAVSDNSRTKTIISFIPPAVFIVCLITVISINRISEHRFKEIPLIQVNEKSITILNCGTGSSGSLSKYIFAEEDANGNIIIQNKQKSNSIDGNVFRTDDDSILKETARISYQHGTYEKFGYTFTANKKGKVYICIAENEYNRLMYFDIYKIIVNDDMNIELENTDHIEYDSNFEKAIADNYSFLLNYIKDTSKATPHKDCAAETQLDFSSDCTEILQAYCRMAKNFCAR